MEIDRCYMVTQTLRWYRHHVYRCDEQPVCLDRLRCCSPHYLAPTILSLRQAKYSHAFLK